MMTFTIRISFDVDRKYMLKTEQVIEQKLRVLGIIFEHKGSLTKLDFEDDCIVIGVIGGALVETIAGKLKNSSVTISIGASL